MIPKKIITQFENAISSSDSYEEFDTKIKFISELPSFIYFRNYLVYSFQNPYKFFQKNFHSMDLVHRTHHQNIINAILFQSEDLKQSNYLVIIPDKEHEKIFRFFTIADFDLSTKIKSKVIKNFYPHFISTFFKQNEIYEALKTFENKILHKYSVIVVDSILKGKDKDPNNYSYIKTERSWKRQTIDEAFEEARERNEWFSSIKFSIYLKNRRGNGKKVADCRIFKDGEIYYSGLNSYVEQFLIESLTGFVDERLQKFQKKGIRERNYQPSIPLEILFDYNKFDDIEEIRRFGSVLTKYPNSTIAIYHSNPYYHANLADFDDGSSFDIWILSSKRVIIKPQLKASPQAFERLISFISSEYGEGEICDYSGQ